MARHTAIIAAIISMSIGMIRGISEAEKEEFCAFSKTWGCTEDCTKICEEAVVCGGSCKDGKIVSLNVSDKQLKEIDPSISKLSFLQNL